MKLTFRLFRRITNLKQKKKYGRRYRCSHREFFGKSHVQSQAWRNATPFLLLFVGFNRLRR